MAVLTCGPEGSGTHLLGAIVREYLGVEPIERSLPYAGHWWIGRVPSDEGVAWYHHDPETGEPYPPGTRVVVITRRPDVTQLALLGRKPPLAATWQQARAQWHRAITELATIPGAYWMSYEALVAAPSVQAANLAAWLGIEPVGVLPQVRDENWKWISYLEP